MYIVFQFFDKINFYILDIWFICILVGLYDFIKYVFFMGGKCIWLVFMLMVYNFYKEDVFFIYDFVMVIEVYYNYIFLYDDLMDWVDMCCGKIIVYKVWNDNIVILLGDVMLVLVYQYMVVSLLEYFKEVMDLFSLIVFEICEGQ